MKDEFEYNDLSYQTWLKPLKPLKLVQDRLYIVASDTAFIVQIVTKRFKEPLSIAIEKLTDLKVTPVFLLEGEPLPDSEQEENRKVTADSDSFDFDEMIRKKGLNPKYTFDSFVSGKSNELAHAASLAVAENPGEDYKILYIYGGVGLGKTHLMHAIANYILRHNPDANVMYVTSEEFTNEFVDSIRNNTTYKFRDKYRSLDVLLIDDIQFLADKESTQEEFFNTFNALYRQNGQIVISSDRTPKEINNLEDRIKSRFEWGIVADIQPPNYETRLAILRKKEDIEGYNIDDEIIKYIASNIKSNIRTLEGALQKIVLKSRLEKKPVDIDTASQILRDFISPDNSPERITPESIVSVVAEHYHLDEKDLISSKKNKELAYPRQIAMYLCCEICDATQKDVGEALGGRDHSTVIHGRNKIAHDLQQDKDLKNVIDILKKKIIP
jgi:chromosomal replication initiator protein